MPDASNPKTWQNQPVWGWRYYVDKEEIDFDEETKRAKHCQLWKIPLPEIKYVRELIRNNMRVKPKLYYTHLGKSHYTYGERAFYCPACDEQFQSIDEYHKHVAQRRWDKMIGDEIKKKQEEEELKRQQHLQIQKFLKEEEKERKRTMASLKLHQRDSKSTKPPKENKIENIENDRTLNRTESNSMERSSEQRRPTRLSRKDSRLAVRQSYFKRVITASREKLIENSELKVGLEDIVEQVQRLSAMKDKDVDRTLPRGGDKSRGGSDHVLLTIDNANSLQLHGTAKSLIKINSKTNVSI